MNHDQDMDILIEEVLAESRLPAGKRDELRKELESHMWEAASALKEQRMNEEEIRSAIRDRFGAPKKIGRSFSFVHGSFLMQWLISLVLVFANSYSALGLLYAAKEGYALAVPAFFFACSTLAHVGYYLWLAKTQRLARSWKTFYIPVAALLFILFMRWIVYPPYLRRVTLNLGEDPFVPGTTITSGLTIPIWQKEFFFSQSRLQDMERQRMQVARQGSLIAHVGDSLQGWSAAKIRSAFGEPAATRQLDAETEVWAYHPWIDHPDWTMPVYIQNSTLLKVGD